MFGCQCLRQETDALLDVLDAVAHAVVRHDLVERVIASLPLCSRIEAALPLHDGAVERWILPSALRYAGDCADVYLASSEQSRHK